MCTIEIMQEKSIIVEMYKCLHSIGPKYLDEIFQINPRRSRKGPLFSQPRAETTRYGIHSLRFQGPKLWNELPVKIKESPSIESLKNSLQNYTGQPCKCSLCK